MDVHRKFQTRYANILHCVLHPDPLNDPVVRGLYLGVQNRKKNRPNDPSREEINRAVGFLHQKINNYNQSVAFLAEVIRNTVAHQREIYPKLHLYITQDKGKYATDEDMLFYMLKGVMAETQLTLLEKAKNQIFKLDIQMKGSAPQLRDYVRALNDIAFKYGELCSIVIDMLYILAV
jgi:hypothetical protein